MDIEELHYRAASLGDAIRYSFGMSDTPSLEFLEGLAKFQATTLVEGFEGDAILAKHRALRVVVTGYSSGQVEPGSIPLYGPLNEPVLLEVVERLANGYRAFMEIQQEDQGKARLHLSDLDGFRVANSSLLLRLVLGAEAKNLFRVEVTD